MKLMEKYGKKKVYIGLATALVVTCAVGIGGIVVYANNKKQTILDSIYIKFIESPTIEYGSESVDYQSFILESVGEVTFPTETIDTKEVGIKELMYKVSQQGYTKEEKLSIEVKDTKAPEITFKEEVVTIEVGAEFDPKSNVEKVIDPVDGVIEEYEVLHNLDNNTVGDYTITIKATDKNGNSAEKSYTVVVKEKEVEESTTNTPNNNTVSNTTGNYTTSKPNSNTTSPSYNDGSSNQSSISNGSSSDNSSNGLGYYPNQIGNSGKVFTSWAEADEWADKELDKYLLEGKYYAYSVISIGVIGRDFDFWTVSFR